MTFLVCGLWHGISLHYMFIFFIAGIHNEHGKHMFRLTKKYELDEYLPFEPTNLHNSYINIKYLLWRIFQ